MVKIMKEIVFKIIIKSEKVPRFIMDRFAEILVWADEKGILLEHEMTAKEK